MNKRKRQSKAKVRRSSPPCPCRKVGQAPTTEWTSEREQALRELGKKLVTTTSTLIY